MTRHHFILTILKSIMILVHVYMYVQKDRRLVSCFHCDEEDRGKTFPKRKFLYTFHFKEEGGKTLIIFSLFFLARYSRIFFISQTFLFNLQNTKDPPLLSYQF